MYTQRVPGLSMEDPTPQLDNPEVVGDLKTWLSGPKSIGSLWVAIFLPRRIGFHHHSVSNRRLDHLLQHWPAETTRRFVIDATFARLLYAHLLKVNNF